LRAEDTLARLGGDEFVVLAPDVGGTRDEASHHGQRLAEKLHALCADPFDVGGRRLHTAASVGLVVIEPEVELEELLRRADAAMYRAKAAGKGRTAFYDESMDQAARDYAHMLERLRIAVAEGGFELCFQPIVRLADGRVTGAEALLRWHDAELGRVPPDRFIPIAEESALIVAIGRWVLEAVCRQWAEWRDRGMMPGFDYLSVNVSPRELQDPGYPERLQSLLRRHRVEPSRLRLEVTESVLAEDIGTVIEALQRIDALGVQCLLDDFGTGDSSLSYLKRLPVSTIKVDREFVRDLQSDPDDAAMIRAVVDIAEQFGCQVVAEGVETEAQRAILLGMSPQMLAQGYLFSAPLPARDLLGQVQQRSAEPGSGADTD
ncbi:MAG: GGDEF domain-containing protein, partial [Gammaproteobacteria bacterium]